MNLKKLFEKHQSRLVAEAIIRSALIGLAVGFAVNTLCAAAAWFFSFGGIWFPIIAGAATAVVCGVFVYFFKLRPNVRDVARRMDALGLEERTVTMLELRNEKTYIAKLQRENTKEHIFKLGDKKIRIMIPRVIVCLVVAAAILGSSMTTVVGLAENGTLPPGPMGGDPDPFENHLSIIYEAGEGGEIEGETEQLVEPGGSGTPVVAVPYEEDGWVFVQWDDGKRGNERCENGVQTNIYVVAIFEKIGEGGDGDSSGEGEGGDGSAEGDKADDVPAGSDANANSDQQGGQGEEGDASGSDGSSDGGKGSGEDEGEGKGEGQGQGAGGKWSESNMFYDGKTYYRDELERYYLMAMEIFEQNGEIPPEFLEFFETYFESI